MITVCKFVLKFVTFIIRHVLEFMLSMVGPDRMDGAG